MPPGIYPSAKRALGVIDIPDTLPIPMPEVTMNTRKGVYVSYAAAPAAS